MISANLAPFKVFFNRDGDTTHNGFTMLDPTHTLGNAASMQDVFCGNVEANGNGSTATLMRSVTSDFVILGIHGMTSLIYLMIYYSIGI